VDVSLLVELKSFLWKLKNGISLLVAKPKDIRSFRAVCEKEKKRRRDPSSSDRQHIWERDKSSLSHLYFSCVPREELKEVFSFGFSHPCEHEIREYCAVGFEWFSLYCTIYFTSL
jgi:hypothetical protein